MALLKEFRSERRMFKLKFPLKKAREFDKEYLEDHKVFEAVRIKAPLGVTLKQDTLTAGSNSPHVSLHEIITQN